MTSDYALIRADNEREYGAGVGRWGQDLLTNRYDDRAHFIFELLQNAEDALARRPGWEGSRAVTFTLSDTSLRIVHSGKPFDSDDVRGICGIAESTKDLTAIGRFGIGFKSVYAFTNRPEVHSGREDFAIESFVWPRAIPALSRRADETVFILPLDATDVAAHAEITEGLRRLGPRTLLFLRQIEEIAWNVDGGPSGIYVRDKPEDIGKDVRRIVLLGEEHGKPDVEETWLVFSREAKTEEGEVAGHVEVAFAITLAADVSGFSVQSVTDSRLVVFFPTVLPTHLGFLVQGPYRTTPSRDNVPRNDVWNQHLTDETATLLVEALRSLRELGLLDVDALLSLPLDGAKFTEGSMFEGLFQAAREALRMEPLLPAHGGGHIAASAAKLGRTQELRELFDRRQLASVFGADSEMVWLSGDITQDRTPELRQYLIRELNIAEIAPEAILPKLNHTFLSAQPDDWIRAFYEFLNGQPALLRQGRLGSVPMIRLEDGSHVAAGVNGEPQAFLPGAVETGFPTVRRGVCNTVESRAFLQTLGLTEPDPVDDVVRNVLTRYRHDEIDIGDADYDSDIRRILGAFATDSKSQRDKLIAALRESFFVMAVDAGDGSKWASKPADLYLATERLKDLFAGVTGVLLADDDYSCLRGEDVRELLEACGATRHLQPLRVSSRFSWQELMEMRTRAGAANSTGTEIVEDFTLRGLHELLVTVLDAEHAATKAALLWDSLCDVEDRRGRSAFVGSYKWFYFHQRSCVFDASFVQQLNATAWIPDANGDLQRPEFVSFDNLGWKPNPFLLSKIRFKPPIIDQLAKEAGIEPGVLELLKKLGVTSEAELRNRLGLKDEPRPAGDGSGDDVDDALKKLLGEIPAPTPPMPDPAGEEPSGLGSGRGGSGRGIGVRAGGGSGEVAGERSDGQGGGRGAGASAGFGKRTPGGAGGQPFISYVAAQPDEEHRDPDGLDQAARMALEAQAINLILAREPKWQRTPTHNPGYDLFEPGEGATPAGWCEVKAMTGSLHDRPVGLSRTQFDCAQKRGDAYWLYVVERADETGARIIRIQDPAGKARTFTFDHGWLDIAEVDAAQENRED